MCERGQLFNYAAFSKAQAMTKASDRPPEWAIKAIEEAAAKFELTEPWQTSLHHFARALAATANRVEIETIMRCAEVPELNNGLDLVAARDHLETVNKILALPRQYKETGNG